MKRFLVSAAAAAAVVTIAGCGSDSDATSTTAVVSVAPPTTAVATNAPTAAPTTAPPATTPPAPTTTQGGAAALPTEICLQRLQEALAIPEADATIEVFYPALAECSGLADWVAAVTATNAFEGLDPVEFAAQTCALDGPMLSVTCQEAMAAAPDANA